MSEAVITEIICIHHFLLHTNMITNSVCTCSNFVQKYKCHRLISVLFAYFRKDHLPWIQTGLHTDILEANTSQMEISWWFPYIFVHTI